MFCNCSSDAPGPVLLNDVDAVSASRMAAFSLEVSGVFLLLPPSYDNDDPILSAEYDERLPGSPADAMDDEVFFPEELSEPERPSLLPELLSALEMLWLLLLLFDPDELLSLEDDELLVFDEDDDDPPEEERLLPPPPPPELLDLLDDFSSEEPLSSLPIRSPPSTCQVQPLGRTLQPIYHPPAPTSAPRHWRTLHRV